MAPTSKTAASTNKSSLHQNKKIKKPKHNKPGSVIKPKQKNKKKQNGTTNIEQVILNPQNKNDENDVVEWPNSTQQMDFFINQYKSNYGDKLSSLELDSLKEIRIVELSPGSDKSTSGNLGEHVKVAFKSSWKKDLCEKQLVEGQVDPGNPAILVISSSAIRALELLSCINDFLIPRKHNNAFKDAGELLVADYPLKKEMRSLTKECHAAKLFSKHMKIEEQVRMLKERVNIASGTPSRIKKLIEMEALGMSRLSLIILDMHTDVKGYSVFTLPQVSDEFWDLYKSFFHQPLLDGKLRLCLYGPIQPNLRKKKKKLDDN